jgi:tetratricopeptide (TPR) repeat protein
MRAFVIPGKMEPEDYLEQGDLANTAGFFTEAKIAMDKGFPNGSRPARTKPRCRRSATAPTSGAADDAKNIDSGIAAAQKSKDGVGLVNLGYNYMTLGQFDKGIDLMKQGIAKGVAKNPEDAKLRLGYALAMAGKKDESIEVLKTVSGNDGRGDLARYWIMYQSAPKMEAAEAK